MTLSFKERHIYGPGLARIKRGRWMEGKLSVGCVKLKNPPGHNDALLDVIIWAHFPEIFAYFLPAA